MRDRLRTLGFAGDVVAYNSWMTDQDLLAPPRKLFANRILKRDSGPADRLLVEPIIAASADLGRLAL
jgi:hypothetical protein